MLYNTQNIVRNICTYQILLVYLYQLKQQIITVMKKGTTIEVKAGKYSGQEMDWTETFTGKKILTSGEIVFHKSEKEIKSFVPKQICVSPFEHGKSYLESTSKKETVKAGYFWSKYIYAIYLPAGFEVETYGTDEYRFDLTSDLKVVFMGIVYEAKGKKIISQKSGKLIDSYIQFSDTVKL